MPESAPRGLTIRSGGQTGVDRAGLEVARELGLSYCGWCPHGGWAEDLPEPPGLLAIYPALTATPSSDPRQRTSWNVRDADATLLIVPTAGFDGSPGTAFTHLCVEVLYPGPFRIVPLDALDPGAEIQAWLRGLGLPHLCLNVAGPRASEVPGIQESALAALRYGLVEAR